MYIVELGLHSLSFSRFLSAVEYVSMCLRVIDDVQEANAATVSDKRLPHELPVLENSIAKIL